MFFDNLNEIEKIAKRTGAAVFVVPDCSKVEIKNAIVVQPDIKPSISIEQIREVLAQVGLKQRNDIFVVIRPAEKMSLDAANAFLKGLEEPNENVHYVLLTDSASSLLATILSRCALYMLRRGDPIKEGIDADADVKDLAKKLLAAKSNELISIAETVAKHKDGARGYALEVLGVAIEMLYKSYFLVNKPVFLQKLPKFLAAYDGIERNGAIKLQIVANLI